MTTESRKVLTAARSDPVGAGIVVSAVVLLMLIAVSALPHDAETTWFQVPELLRRGRAARPLPQPPAEWLAQARADDVLVVPGFRVAYWGRHDAPYGRSVTERAGKPIAIVAHFTDNRPIINLVRYQHSGDSDRGGAYGYHVYIDAAGHIVQGAPLSRRTNHIKPAGHPMRHRVASGLDGSNTIGVSLVGACRSPALLPITYRCARETVTTEQLEAGLAVVRAMQRLYGIPCSAVYGHGELQRDRNPFEGATLAAKARACT